MADLFYREFQSDMEVRAAGDGRTVHGIAVPYDVPAEIFEWGHTYRESFAHGAFARTIAERGDRVKFLSQHDSTKPLGRATSLREDARGLYAEFRVSKTPLGDETLELIRDGALDSFSIGFLPVQPAADYHGAEVRRTEVKLREVSAVTFPAYEGALVAGVRSLDDGTISRAVEFAAELRAGKSISAEHTATLKHVLSLVAAADSAVDETQPLLANLLGVPNPDTKQDTEDKADDGDKPRGMDAETMRRKALLLGIRL